MEDCWFGSLKFENCCDLKHGDEGNVKCWDPPAYTYRKCCEVELPVAPEGEERVLSEEEMLQKDGGNDKINFIKNQQKKYFSK